MPIRAAGHVLLPVTGKRLGVGHGRAFHRHVRRRSRPVDRRGRPRRSWSQRSWLAPSSSSPRVVEVSCVVFTTVVVGAGWSWSPSWSSCSSRCTADSSRPSSSSSPSWSVVALGRGRRPRGRGRRPRGRGRRPLGSWSSSPSGSWSCVVPSDRGRRRPRIVVVVRRRDRGASSLVGRGRRALTLTARRCSRRSSMSRSARFLPLLDRVLVVVVRTVRTRRSCERAADDQVDLVEARHVPARHGESQRVLRRRARRRGDLHCPACRGVPQ